MANKKISELAVATAPTGAELAEIVQGGVNKQTTLQDIANLAPGSAVADASATVKGVVEVAIMSEVVAGTDTGGTGALLSVLPSQLGITRTVTGADASVQTDHNGLIIFNSATPFNFTLDQLLAKTRITFINYGAGAVTFIAGAGVTITGTVTLAAAADPSFPSSLVIYDTLTTPRMITGGADVVPASAADLVTGTDNAKTVTSLAFKGFRNLTRTAASVSAGTMTITFAADEQERRFEATTTISSNFTLAFGGTLTAIEVFTLILPINGSIAITLPSTVIGERNDSRFVNATKILTLTSTASGDIFELSFTRKDGPKYMLRAGYAQIAT